mgnify:CR=1 FL=1
MAKTSTITSLDTREARMVILLAGDVIAELATDEIRACACECAIDESCYSCNDCNDEPECAC